MNIYGLKKHQLNNLIVDKIMIQVAEVYGREQDMFVLSFTFSISYREFTDQ